MGSSDVAPELVDYCKGLKVPTLPFSEESLTSGKYIDEYNAFYDQL
jgi:hypothetical protein